MVTLSSLLRIMQLWQLQCKSSFLSTQPYRSSSTTMGSTNVSRLLLHISLTPGPLQSCTALQSKIIKIPRPTVTDVDWLRVVTFQSSNDVIQSLKAELPDYIAKANSTPNVSDDLTDTLPWWKATAQDLPCGAAAVHKMVLVQPSSAAAERVFSLLVIMFGDQQHEALEDYLEAALMLRINIVASLEAKATYW